MNDIIIEIAREDLFTAIWEIPQYIESDPSEYYENPARQKNSLYSSMMDCQLVLRFFALRDDQNIRGSMKGILDRCMSQNQNISLDEAEQYREIYLSRLAASYELFEGHPFELPPDSKGKTRLSIALSDAIMVALDRRWEQRSAIMSAGHKIRPAIAKLLADPD